MIKVLVKSITITLFQLRGKSSLLTRRKLIFNPYLITSLISEKAYKIKF